MNNVRKDKNKSLAEAAIGTRQARMYRRDVKIEIKGKRFSYVNIRERDWYLLI